MNDENKNTTFGIGGMASPPQALLERVAFQIKVMEDKLKTLKALYIRLSADPELEDLIERSRYTILQ